LRGAAIWFYDKIASSAYGLLAMTRRGAIVNNKPLSVAMILQNFHPYIGGAEKQALSLSRALKARGVNVKVVTQRRAGAPDHDAVDGILVRRLPGRGRGLLSSLVFMTFLLVYLLRFGRAYDVFHVHLASSHALAAGLAGRLLRKRVFVKLSGTAMTGQIGLSEKNILGRLKLKALAWLSPILIAVNSEQIEELQRPGLSRAPVVLLPNGVDTAAFFPVAPEEKDRLKIEWGWKGPVFLYTGRFSPDKPHPDILRVFLTGWARAVRPGAARFYLVGEGPERENILGLIKELDLEDSVFVWEARPDVSRLYQAADVFVLPTISEGLSNALLEAMASGLPVLATAAPGNADIVKEGINGFLFNPKESVDAARCLSAVLNHAVSLNPMGAHARKTAEAYSLDAAADKYVRLYRGEIV